MTKVVDSSEYRANAIFVGCSVNEDGEPLVEINGKAIGTVDGLLETIGMYEAQDRSGRESISNRLSILESKVEELDCQINRQIEYGIRVLEKRTLRDAQ
ncbi:hypothetical protein [Agrobacterium fabrum]|uniref:hypothetical protein n=1 Tax=Agrobacterium fabrum TaxID=1176649 RepID=UPI002472EDA5|nr:hypothetical protein [Agrobacterium fabrum]MDH6294683.1 hypothetical protein [Agrobacterium fabrum]